MDTRKFKSKMTDKIFGNNRLVLVILLCCACINMNCAVQTMYFTMMPSLSNKICVDDEKMFEIFVRSKVMCSKLCDDYAECGTIFYEHVSRICTMCSGKSNLEGKGGTLCYVKNNAVTSNCGEPPSVDDGVITSVGGYTFGDIASYTCSECSHTPANGVGTITCQADGTWTTPACAPAIDVGYLPNGQVIPTGAIDGQLIPIGAIGCVATGGSTCLSSSFSAHVNNGLRSNGDMGECWCGKLCCTSNFFCCHDVKC